MLVESQRCRRCRYRRLIKLQKMRDDDHDVYRCAECGYIFSPPLDTEQDSGPGTSGRLQEERRGASRPPRRAGESSL